MAAALVRAIKSLPAFPKDGQIEIVDLGRGSLKIRLEFYFALVATVATVGSFGKDIADLLREPDSELAQCVAWTMIEDGVTKAGISCAGEYEILRDQMPAVARLTAAITTTEAGRQKRDDGDAPVDVARVGLRADQGPSETPPHSAKHRGDLPDHSTFVNVPPAPETAELPGHFTKAGGEMAFIQPNGQVGWLEEDVRHDLPLDIPVMATMSAVRGSRGGWADRKLRVIGWIPIYDETADAAEATRPRAGRPRPKALAWRPTTVGTKGRMYLDVASLHVEALIKAIEGVGGVLSARPDSIGDRRSIIAVELPAAAEAVQRSIADRVIAAAVLIDPSIGLAS